MRELPSQLTDVLEDLRSQEWIQKLAQNAELYVVGGIVRDAFLGKESKDVDLIVDGLSVDGIIKILKPFGKASLEGESFSVVKFRPTGWEGEDYDIAVPRVDRKIGKGHKGFEIVTDGVTVEDDLLRRDFTINSMAVNVMTGELLDPFNGLRDIKKGVMRATDPNAFVEDPLRIVRGIQFASRFGFDIEPETMKLMQKNSHLIKEITGERIHDEFMKILKKGGDTQKAVDLLHQTGADEALFDQKMLYYEDAVGNLDDISFLFVLGLLGGVDPVDFYKNRLKGNVKMAKDIAALDNILLKWEQLDEEEKRYLVMKTMDKTPDVAEAILIPDEMRDIVVKMRTMKIPMNSNDIPITGDDVMEIFQIPKSQKVGEILEEIRKAALMNEFNWKSKEDTLEFVKKLARE
jgi:tRNA nucleotidyltransferase/poly(A) polymerase